MEVGYFDCHLKLWNISQRHVDGQINKLIVAKNLNHVLTTHVVCNPEVASFVSEAEPDAEQRDSASPGR